MAKTIQAIRGMNDILPQHTGAWQWLEAETRAVFGVYGYQEIRLPIVEKTELFKRSIGEVTDIVEKEMYTFDDRNGDSLTLRPEGTAGCVRAGIEHGLLHNQVQRLWYIGPMFRHERPQKGRYRQFHQIGVEAFGMPGPDIDAEIILLTARLWRALGLQDVELQINSLGSPAARADYRDKLVAWFKGRIKDLDEDSRRRLETNPLRILDSKNPDMQSLIAEAPVLADSLDEESARHFDTLQQLLADAGVEFVVNPRLVRGLDYYEKTVFEWVTDRLGAQGTVCAGGRYDGLVSQLGGRATPAAGFAMGIERLISLAGENCGDAQGVPGVYIVLPGDGVVSAGMQLAERLRSQLPGIKVLCHCGGGGMKSQFKKADRSGALFALVLGEEELLNKEVTVKPLRGQGEQRSILLDEAGTFLKDLLVSG